MSKDLDISDLVGAYPVCGACGSRDVVRDAWAKWSMVTREWELKAVFDDFSCDGCGLVGLPGWKLDEEFRQKRIRRLNDGLRRGQCEHATIVMTAGVQAEGQEFLVEVSRSVTSFDAFGEDNDPHGEHDFGAFEVGNQKLFWKIDYYDQGLKMGSPDPANPSITHRVLTIMLASEY